MIISYEEAQKRYGKIQNGIWADEAKWCILFQVPESISHFWINSLTGFPTTHIYINKDMEEALSNALKLTEERNVSTFLHTFGGAFMVRDVRGFPGKPSCHSYALAIDINEKENPLGQANQQNLGLVGCFKDAGFDWGGEFKSRCDAQHFSYGWE